MYSKKSLVNSYTIQKLNGGNFMKEKIRQMHENGYSIEEIAENLSEFDCVQSFTDCPDWCHEYYDCNECWNKCLKKELRGNK